jgi:hypothetical protein
MGANEISFYSFGAKISDLRGEIRDGFAGTREGKRRVVNTINSVDGRDEHTRTEVDAAIARLQAATTRPRRVDTLAKQVPTQAALNEMRARLDSIEARGASCAGSSRGDGVDYVSCIPAEASRGCMRTWAFGLCSRR